MRNDIYAQNDNKLVKYMNTDLSLLCLIFFLYFHLRPHVINYYKLYVYTTYFHFPY